MKSIWRSVFVAWYAVWIVCGLLFLVYKYGQFQRLSYWRQQFASQRESALAAYRWLSLEMDNVEMWYWLTGESLLGLESHGGFIPWNDCFELAIADADGAVEPLSQKLSTLGTLIAERYPGHRLERDADALTYRLVGPEKATLVKLTIYQPDDRDSSKLVVASASLRNAEAAFDRADLVRLSTERIFEGIAVKTPRSSRAWTLATFGHEAVSRTVTDSPPHAGDQTLWNIQNTWCLKIIAALLPFRVNINR